MTEKENNKEKKKRRFDILSLILTVMIVIVSVLSVNCYIEQYEKNYKAEKLKKELSQAQNDGELLKIEYQRRANYKTIEEYVSSNLSMEKINSYQIEYLRKENNNTMQYVKNDEDNDSFASKISKAFSVILEYFK